MRRSAAPSQRTSFPLINNCSSSILANKEIERNEGTLSNVINTPHAEKLSPQESCSGRNSQSDSCSSISSSDVVKRADNNEGTKTIRFAAVWSKVSNRKHKVWEGDCTVVTDGRTTTVKNPDGQTIGVSSGVFKKAKLDDIDCGYRFVISGKEVEICDRMVDSDENVLTTTSLTTISCNEPPKRRSGLQRVVDENMFVLPRPSTEHSAKHNVENATVVDVVVDRHLTQNLRPHQKDGVVFLYECVTGMKNFDGCGAILADEMGLGKTLQCITCLWTLLKQGPYDGRPIVRRCLIVVPSSLMNNWLNEFKKWLGVGRVKITIAKKSSEVKNFSNDESSVLIISYELALRCRCELDAIDFDLLICDEGHRLKNSSVKTNFLLTSLPIKRRILLSGTPLQNDLNELYTLSDFVNPGILGGRNDFRHDFESVIIRSQQPDADDEEKAAGETKIKELSVITQQFLLRRTAELNKSYLPSKIEYVLFCKPSELQTTLYEKLLDSKFVKRSLRRDDGGDQQSYAEPLMCIDALRKLCNHPALFYNAQAERTSFNEKSWALYEELLSEFPVDYRNFLVSVEHSGKLQCLFDLLSGIRRNKCPEKVVVVSNFTFTLDLLASLCNDMKYKYLRLDGGTINSARMKLVNQFNNPDDDTFVFLLSSKAGGLGLNLIGANRVVLYDVDWNPANDLQSMARIWRDGQKRGTIEEKMFQRQIKKQNLSGTVVDLHADDSSKIRFSSEELKDIFTLHVETNCHTHDLLNCTCSGTGTEEESDRDDCSVKDDVEVKETSLVTKSKKLVGVSQLMKWEHRNGNNLSNDLPSESCIDLCSSVTFALYYEHSDNSGINE